MLDVLLPPSPCFLMMTNQWWEELFLSFPSVTPIGKSEDWESMRKSKVVEAVRAISSCDDINKGFIALLLKMVNTADARHQVSWTMEQLHCMCCVHCVYCMYCVYCVYSMDCVYCVYSMDCKYCMHCMYCVYCMDSMDILHTYLHVRTCKCI